MIHNSKTLAHRLGATLFALAVATIAPMSVADAATLPVRVTQTENGGKLEISLGGAPFRVETNAPRTLDITVLGLTEGFDLSAVPEDGFGGVSSARSELTPQGARLRLVLNCDCQYGASVNDGLLGIDISSRTISTAADDPPFENPKASLRSRIGGTKYAPLRAPAPLAKRSTPTSESFSKASSDEVSNEVSISNDDAKERQEDVKLARKRLLEQLTRAADQGLLKFEGDAQTDMRGVIPSPNAVQIASNGDSAGETSEVDSNSEAVESAPEAPEPVVETAAPGAEPADVPTAVSAETPDVVEKAAPVSAAAAGAAATAVVTSDPEPVRNRSL